MQREIITYATETEWLANRKKDVTSTEVAALFGASPYMTEFELFHRKAGNLSTDDFALNNRIVWGNRLEAAIAHGVAEDLGLVVEPFKVYARIPEIRLGCSFDFKIVGMVEGFTGNEWAREQFREHGAGVMEIKNVDGLAFKRGWIDDGDELEAPPHIELQVQTQLEVADLNWSIIAPLVGGHTPRPMLRRRDREAGAIICARTAEFWKRYDRGEAPEPEYAKDKGTIGLLFLNNDGSEVDLTDNSRLFELCLVRKEACEGIKRYEEKKDAATAEILTIVGAHKKAYAAGGFTVSAGTTAGSTYTVERQPFRSVRVTQKGV